MEKFKRIFVVVLDSLGVGLCWMRCSSETQVQYPGPYSGLQIQERAASSDSHPGENGDREYPSP